MTDNLEELAKLVGYPCQYRIGETVRIRDRENIPENCIFGFVDSMNKYCGKEATITNISTGIFKGEEKYRFYFDNDEEAWLWSEDMLEPLIVNEPNIDEWNDILNES